MEGFLKEDGRALRSLWKEAFADTERYMDFYFAKKAARSGIYTDRERERLAAMAFFTPYPEKLFGKNYTASYIVGVATHERYRGEHRMTRILREGMAACERKGAPLVFLCPETPAVYTSLGFRPVYWRETTFLGPDYKPGAPRGRVRAWEELAAPERGHVVQFVNAQLEREGFDLFIERSAAYYDETASELKALDGKLFTVWHNGDLLAVMHLIYEESRYQLTECVVRPLDGKQAIDALLHFLRADSLQIDDSYFLTELNGRGITREKQPKPYIMCRMLAGETPPLRCYINDIT